MKINSGNTKTSIVLSIIYVCLQLGFSLTIIFDIKTIDYSYYIMSAFDFLFFLWIGLYAIALLKATNQQPLIMSVFAVCIIYSLADFVVGATLALINASNHVLVTYSTISTTAGPLIALFLLVTTFFIKHPVVKTPLQILALSKLLSMVVYALIPYLIASYYSNPGNLNFLTYSSLIDLLIPVAAIYLAVTVLNLLNSRQNTGTAGYQEPIQSGWLNE